ncbi:D-glycerate dehydrogenase [Roseovarius sp. LXJ103]|uniref:2-hydroxyacid dehydrogenase n=1 Tax=Roseovarius carneus TaxID=2853164 RepID=UPI000D61534C|nr:D-glycerate dehydrogenase [Roseovarius carneus]MBZ8117425.1 D-glycerate dehydrogenase [Roseovarius carneus]PWE36768.1 D-glycerate dehydrogenase [Pelagicola sp. LXJ1103]
MIRVFLTRPLPEAVITAAEAAFEVEIRDSTAAMKPAEMRAALALYDGVLATLGDTFDVEIFGDAPHRCKVISNFGVGYNHIDATAARACGITVTNTPGAVTDATADIAMTLMLMTARRAGEGERILRAGRWDGWHPTQLLGTHVTGKTAGIIGMGRIGTAIAQRCHYGFGMDVLYTARSDKDVPFPATRMALWDVLSRADITFICVPGGAETYHMIDAAALKQMPTHAHLINIARGDIISEAALIAALQKGMIAGAGLDVYEHEPKVPEALIAMENVTLLPHMGTGALEVRTRIGMLAVENLKTFFETGTGPHLVN